MNVSAPMVGTIASVDVNVGDQVKANDILATLEAMKMIVEVFAPTDGTVKEINIKAGDVVNPDMILMTLE